MRTPVPITPEFIQAIRDCPDERVLVLDGTGRRPRSIHRLTYDIGIHDNCHIGLEVPDHAQFILDIVSLGFTLRPENYGIPVVPGNENHYHFSYDPGTVEMQVKTDRYGHVSSEPWSFALILHPYQKDKKVPNKDWERVIADVICLFGEYCQQRHYSLQHLDRPWKELCELAPPI